MSEEILNPSDEIGTSDEVKIEDFNLSSMEDSNIEEIEELEPLKLADDISIINDENEETAMVQTTTQTTIYVATTSEKNEVDDDEDADDEFEDETLVERLVGLTEMFPDVVRNTACTMSKSSLYCVKSLYQLSRSAVWVLATSAIILAAPSLIENEKAQLDELSRQQQRQILLGPSVGQGAPGLSPTLTPPVR